MSDQREDERTLPPDPDATLAPVAQQPHTMTPQPRTYEVGGEIAHGGMGAILRAKDLSIDRTVAMKVILDAKQTQPELLERFVQEAKLTGQLEHPGIVPIYEVSTDEQGRPFYAMKFVKGITLNEVLHRIKSGDPETIAKYPLTHLLTIFQKVCDAVAFAHSKGVVHRDLKPANIMIGEYGEVLVMDWGLAKVVSHQSSVIGTPSPTDHCSLVTDHSPALTLSGQIMGTPQFMAPEQAEGKVDEIDGRTDIFSLGAILYSILTLRPPVSGQTANEVLKKIRSGEIAPPTSFNPAGRVRSRALQRGLEMAPATGEQSALKRSTTNLPHCPDRRVPSSLSAVTMKALALKPEDRYQTVKDFQKDIEAFQGGFATFAEQAGTLRLFWLLIKRHKTEATALGVILALVIGFGTNAIVTGRRASATLTELRGTAPTFFAQAEALIKEHQFEDALQKISYALVLAPTDARYHAMKGNILQSLLRFSEAEQAYAEAIRWNKNQPLAGENLKLCQKLRQQNEGRAEVLPGSLSELQAAMRQQQRFDEAVAMTIRLPKYDAQAYETWKAFLLKSGLVPPGLIEQRYTMNETGMINLSLRFLNPPSLASLKGMPAIYLDLSVDANSAPGLTDLSPLKGMPLEWLSLAGNKHITDLSPLKGMPLKWLYLGHCESLVDLSPLKGMQIQELAPSQTQVSDLSPLRGMPLRSLLVGHTPVTDLSPLEGMPLKKLALEDCKVADISPLHGMPLAMLSLNHTLVSDLRVLRGMPLKDLELFDCEKLQDLMPLADCPTLERLNLPAQCKDIEFLRRLPHLQRLSYENLPWDKTKTAAEFWKEYDAKKAGGSSQ